jgi:protein-tyrosine phosphatase
VFIPGHFSFNVTDTHCHILPDVDDGPKDWATSLEMCRIAVADGIRGIVATPHANYRYPYDRDRHAESLAQLQQSVPEIEFSLGCDFYLSDDNISDAVRHPERYVIGETPYILVEFGDFQTPYQMTESLFRLHSAGLLAIVSHPERNPVIEEHPDLSQEFFDMGAALQITAGSLCGDWGRKAKKTCETLLKMGLVSLIASDAHEAKRRKPVLSEARRAAAKVLCTYAAADLLVRDNPRAVVCSRALA